MENEEAKEKIPHKKRRVSLFRRRKKSDIRPFVREHKKVQYKKILLKIFFIVVILIIMSGILYAVRFFILEALVSRSEIITPQGTSIPDKDAVVRTILDRFPVATAIENYDQVFEATFMIGKETRVYVKTDKSLETQLELVEAISKQIEMDGKKAISIDLRYNKPIVKF